MRNATQQKRIIFYRNINNVCEFLFLNAVQNRHNSFVSLFTMSNFERNSAVFLGMLACVNLPSQAKVKQKKQ